MKKILLIFTLIILSNQSCKKNQIPLFDPIINVTYEVKGTAKEFKIRYIDEFGKFDSLDTNVTWRYKFKCKAEKYVFLNAINKTPEGYVKVVIKRNNKVFVQDESFSPYGAAVASGNIK